MLWEAVSTSLQFIGACVDSNSRLLIWLSMRQCTFRRQRSRAQHVRAAGHGRSASHNDNVQLFAARPGSKRKGYHSGLNCLSSSACNMSSETALVYTKRCVVHVDVDAFYAQCEEIRNPSLRERPLGAIRCLSSNAATTSVRTAPMYRLCIQA